MIPNRFYLTLKRVIPYVFWMTCIVTLISTLMPAAHIPKDIKIWDKAEHFIVFFMLMFTGGIAYSKQTFLLATGLMFYGASIEIMQEYFTTSRNGDKFDIVADWLGVFAGLLAFWLVYKLSHKKDGTIV